MNRMKMIKKNRKLHKEFCRAMGCFLITLVLLCAAGGNLFAKYYAGQKNKGVAMASSLYFDSNVLKKVKDAANTSDYPAIFNKEPWNGTGECTIDVDIRNFSNQLLYNDKNLNITYNISFVLEEASEDDTTYSVTYTSGSENQTQTITTSGCTFENLTLEGGKQDQHVFKVSIKRPEDAVGSTDYTSKRIKVIATPVSPSYVTNSEKLGGFIFATSIAAGYSFQAGFDNGVNIDGFAGYPYSISYTPDLDQMPHKVKLSWDTQQLEIDKFSSYYPYGGGNNDTNKNWKYIELTIQPYSTIHITFFRVAGFNANKLEDCVKVTDLDHNTEGSGN